MSDIFEPASGFRGMRDPDARALARRMTALKTLANNKGYFDVPLWEQALRCFELVALPLLAFVLLARGGGAAAAGAIVLALHYLRTAYLGHDLAHNQWGPRNDAKPRFMLGAVALLQGFGSTWWVEKHELHHAFPNGCRVNDSGILTPIDGDINSAPWIVWDKMLTEYNSNALKSTWGKLLASALLRVQTQLFFPFLSVARFNWSWQSVDTAVRKRKFGEAALCAAHWILGLTLAGGPHAGSGLDWRGLVPVRAAFGRISSRDRLRPQPHGYGCLRREQGRRLLRQAGPSHPEHAKLHILRLDHRRPQQPDRAPHVPDDGPAQSAQDARIDKSRRAGMRIRL